MLYLCLVVIATWCEFFVVIVTRVKSIFFEIRESTSDARFKANVFSSKSPLNQAIKYVNEIIEFYEEGLNYVNTHRM